MESRASFEVLDEPGRILFTLGNIRARIDQGVLDALSSHEYKLLLQSYRLVEDICLGEKAFISSEGKEEATIDNRQELLQFFIDRAKKGQYIQRYKGLGEMNPEQLWETTMNPVNRRFLRIAQEDAVEAEKIFTTLMGDKVEPRRDFIEKHALDVRNLDV